MNEAEPRTNLIDSALKQAGWNMVEHNYIGREVICTGRILSRPFFSFKGKVFQ